MTYPAKPSAAYDYVTFQAGSPTTPLPANQVAADYAGRKTSIDAIVEFLKVALRSDAKIQNGSINIESLSAAALTLLKSGVVPKGAWVTATVYAVNALVTQSSSIYVCLVAHTSGVFATDLAAGNWQLVGVGFDATLAIAFTGVNTHSGSETFSGTTGFSGVVTMTGKALNEAQGADIASAATTDIGAAAGNYVKVTGTTTITALGTIQAGTRRFVEFTGALLLTHNATSLILPNNGSNITTAAGDCAEFVSEGSGNWRCVVYQRAAINSNVGTTYVLTTNVTLSTTMATPTALFTTSSLPPGTYEISAVLALNNGGAGNSTVVAGISNGSTMICGGETSMAVGFASMMTIGAVVVITASTTFSLLAAASGTSTGAVRAPTNAIVPSINDKMTSITIKRLS